jgi:hypothetical protein
VDCDPQLSAEFGVDLSFEGTGSKNRLTPGEIATDQTIAFRDSGGPIKRSVKVMPDVPSTLNAKRPTLQIQQLWEGTVTEVHGESFVAILNDKSKLDSPAEQVEFDSVELRVDDQSLVLPGAVFYWTIGKETWPSGQVQSISRIEFSRLPVWTRNSLRSAKEKSVQIEQWFHPNGVHAS